MYKSAIHVLGIAAGMVWLAGCTSSDAPKEQGNMPLKVDFRSTDSLNNNAAYVTSQCYTKTEDSEGGVHNPCFTCHINSKAPNYINDADLQESYDFSEYTKVNRFTNLFKDRTEAVARISDSRILEYVREDNYKNNEGALLLSEKLHNLPQAWDVNENGKWDGYMPDCYFSFDAEGFDRDPQGNYTGWRAFAYYPFLGTFWPTNGSTDDVLIRLPKEFREDRNGEENPMIYKVNLAIVESLIKEEDIMIDEVDETALGVDLDQDGMLGRATMVKFNWVKPTYDPATNTIRDFSMQYVGRANALLQSNEHLIAPGLYPKGTEFLHSVRYIDIDENNTTIKMAPRMKELRYGRKTHWNSYAQMQNAATSEIKEKDQFPDRLRTIIGNSEEGLGTGLGWVYQGFIEDAEGDLRPQNYEETQFCIGCHSGIGAIADSTFVFQRKFGEKGWYHWSQDPNGLKDISEPLTRDGRGEYRRYLELNHAGDEFRANDEVMKRFFDESGALKEDEAAKIKEDISYLLYPSTKRALDLNKAYKVIVDEQSYIYGRDAHIKPVTNVHKKVESGQPTGIERVEL
ncbi:MAG: hypothetical protein ACP5D3_01970 [Sulfurovum sp.]